MIPRVLAACGVLVLSCLGMTGCSSGGPEPGKGPKAGSATPRDAGAGNPATKQDAAAPTPPGRLDAQPRPAPSPGTGTPRKGEGSNPTPTRPRTPEGTTAGNEPEAEAYARKRGWHLSSGPVLLDGKSRLILSIVDPVKPYGDATLTPEDARMIARLRAVQSLNLVGVKNLTDALVAGLVGMPRLEVISFSAEDLTDAAFKSFARMPSLEAIHCISAKITDEGISALKALPRLKYLFLMQGEFRGTGFKDLAGLKGLDRLSIKYCPQFDDEGARAVGQLPGLIDLEVDRSKMTSDGLAALVARRVPPKFTFDTRLLNDAALKLLVEKGWLYRLLDEQHPERKQPTRADEVRHLSLGDSRVTDRGFEAVETCTNLETISLENAPITDVTGVKLARFPRLTTVSLGGTKVTAKTLDALAACRQLKSLDLERVELADDALGAVGRIGSLESVNLRDAKYRPAALAGLSKLERLKRLTLSSPDVDDAALKPLLALTGLEELVLNYTRIGDATLKELSQLKGLRSLYLSGTKVTQAASEQFKKDHPKCFVLH